MPPRVLASGPKPCGGNKESNAVTLISVIKIVSLMCNLSNRPQVSMGYRLINRVGCW